MHLVLAHQSFIANLVNLELNIYVISDVVRLSSLHRHISETKLDRPTVTVEHC